MGDGDLSVVPKYISLPNGPGGERVKRRGYEAQPQAPDPDLCRSRKAGKVSAAISGELALGCQPDVFDLLKSGFSFARYLIPQVPVPDSITGLWSQVGYDFQINTALNVDSVPIIRAPMTQSWLVRNFHARASARAVGTVVISGEVVNIAGTLSRAFAGSSNQGTSNPIIEKEEIWIPAGQGLQFNFNVIVPDATNFDWVVGCAIYAFDPLVFPLCC